MKTSVLTLAYGTTNYRRMEIEDEKQTNIRRPSQLIRESSFHF